MTKNLTFKDLDKEIGQKIKECRKKEGASQLALANLLNFDSPTAISLIESGERSLKIHDLIIICQIFEKDYNYFIGRPSDHKRVKIEK